MKITNITTCTSVKIIRLLEINTIADIPSNLFYCIDNQINKKGHPLRDTLLKFNLNLSKRKRPLYHYLLFIISIAIINTGNLVGFIAVLIFYLLVINTIFRHIVGSAT